jgi:hypothetical protein
MSIIYFTNCNTCGFNLSEYFYRLIVEKESIENIEKELKRSCCLIVFKGQRFTNKIYGLPKYSAFRRKTHNDITPIHY